MADEGKNKIDKNESPARAPSSTRTSAETPKEVSSSRVEIAGALVEGHEGGEVLDVGEVRETMGEGRETKGDGAGTKKKDDSKATAQTTTAGTATGFTFDESNLPPAPEMIRRIEDALRAEIRKLERAVKKYQGSLFRQADPEKLSETMIEIRKKNVLLRRLVSLASVALKRLFLQMFGTKR